MSYSLFWRSPTLPYTQKQSPIVVPAGAVISNAASLKFTGKGAANYGKIQQENQLLLLENFAGSTAPSNATVGQTWYDTSSGTLKVCVSTAPEPEIWRSMNATQVTDVGANPPSPASLGDTWYQRTGSASGIQYVYTGLGRFPEQTWNATTAGYYPTTSTTLAAKINYGTFTTPNFGEVYISGISAGVQADIDGTILVNGVSTSVPRNVVPTSRSGANSFIVWDTTGTLVTEVPTSQFCQVRQLIDGTWQYDTNNAWVTFTPIDGMYVIGLVTVLELDDGNAPGIDSAQMWSEALPLVEMMQAPNIQADGAIGGWQQMFPEVMTAAGREEYAYLIGLLSQLIGDTAAFGGAGAIGRSVDYLTPLNTLDASLQLAWQGIAPNDSNVLADPVLLNQLRVDLTSQDWDLLLAAARYAVNRLELPAGMIDDISDLPFVMDGRPAPDLLLSMNPLDPLEAILIPSARRKTNPRLGVISLSRLYQETINVLAAAISNRYILKGMQGTSGVHTTFSSNVAVAGHTTFTANATGSTFASTITHGVTFNFTNEDVNLQRFFCAGQAIELVMMHQPSGSPTTADTNFATVCNTYGRFRITNDAVYVMNNSNTPALSSVPGSVGFSSVTSAGVVLATATSGGAQLTLRAQLQSDNAVRVYIDVLAGGNTTGQTFAFWNLITDNETYGAARVYPIPATYQVADKLGSAAFV